MITPLPKKILIVEDDLTIRRLIEVCLRSVPALQVAVAEGNAALEVLRREKIDLVVTDLLMPEADGLAVVRSMRANPLLRDIPVMLLSSLGNPALPAEAEADLAASIASAPDELKAALARLGRAALSRSNERD